METVHYRNFMQIDSAVYLMAQATPIKLKRPNAFMTAYIITVKTEKNIY
jgi:hypothetical protein